MRAPHFLLLLLPLTACAEGGSTETPTSEIRISANHQMFGLVSRAIFGEYPLKPAFALSDVGTFTMSDNSTYQVRRSGNNGTPDQYALGNKGDLVLRVRVSGRTAPTRYIGAYTLDGTTKAYFFTDRFAPTATSGVGLFWGTQFIAGTPDPTGDWHAFSLHLIFSKSQVLDSDNVARTAAGTISINNAGAITGTGKESTKASLKFTGSAQGFADGEVTVSLDYDDSQSKDQRSFAAGLSHNVILGGDDVAKGDEGGLLAMIRKRTGNIDMAKFAGTYRIGLQTVFVDPSNSGSDAAVGTVTINDKGGFRIEATGQQGGRGRPFTYTGSLTAANDGGLTLTVNETKETWQGAVDQDYKVLVICDNQIEQRTFPENPEVSILIGMREAEGQ